MRRRILFILLFSVVAFRSISAQDSIQQNVPEKEAVAADAPLSVMEQTQKEYDEKNYRKTIEILESEIKSLQEQGKVSAQLYYNLGNDYFRVNEFPQALLNYERAYLYNPGDRDIRHNIEYARTKIEDKILTADTFFLRIWFEGVQNLLTSDGWAKFAILFFIVLIAGAALFVFSPNLRLKKTGFYVGITMLVFLLLSNIFAYRQKKKIETRNTAIIMAASVPVASSPSGASKELFVLHAGTKVEITNSDGNWYEIELANGSVGWIKKEKLEII
jgi:tetratricopeptide (TPR) repeat protein